MKALALVAGLVAGSCVAAGAQMNAPAKKNYVTFTAEPQAVASGKPATVQLRFHVMDGYHVNSHTPKSELLIPTTLKLDPADGVKPGSPEYPAGKPYSFSFDPTEKLDVYAGDFLVKLPVTATPGEHVVSAALKYQACDNAACYPPRTLPVQITFTAK